MVRQIVNIFYFSLYLQSQSGTFVPMAVPTSDRRDYVTPKPDITFLKGIRTMTQTNVSSNSVVSNIGETIVTQTLTPGIDPEEWVKHCQKMGQCDPVIFSVLLQTASALIDFYGQHLQLTDTPL